MAAFLEGRIPWAASPRWWRAPSTRYDAPRRRPRAEPGPDRSVEDVLDADATARRLAERRGGRAGGRGVSATDAAAAGPPPVDPGGRRSRPAGSADRVESPGRAAPSSWSWPLGRHRGRQAVAAGHADLLIVVVCMVVIVMVHELGHLLAAKRGGMKVTEYFLGFGPRLWSFRRGETEYGIKALPLGWLREDPRHDQPRGGRPGRRAPHLPPAAVPRPAPGGGGRLGHALPDGLRAAVGAAHLRRRAQRRPWSASRQLDPVGGRPGPAAVAGCAPATCSSRWTAGRSAATLDV